MTISRLTPFESPGMVAFFSVADHERPRGGTFQIRLDEICELHGGSPISLMEDIRAISSLRFHTPRGETFPTMPLITFLAGRTETFPGRERVHGEFRLAPFRQFCPEIIRQGWSAVLEFEALIGGLFDDLIATPKSSRR